MSERVTIRTDGAGQYDTPQHCGLCDRVRECALRSRCDTTGRTFARCASMTDGGRYRCGRAKGHEGMHRAANTFTRRED